MCAHRWHLAACLVGILAATARAEDWPQWLGPQRDGVWRETGIRAAFPEGGPTLRWRTPIGGGYAGPAIAGVASSSPIGGTMMPHPAFANRSVYARNDREIVCVSLAAK